MKIDFKDAASLVRARGDEPLTFVFIGSGYPFPAAEIFSRFLSHHFDKEVLFRDEPCPVDPGTLNLFSSLESADNILPFLSLNTGSHRIIPFLGGLFLKKTQWGKAVGESIIVEVPEPTSSSLIDDLQYGCSLVGVDYKSEGIEIAKENFSEGWGGILQIAEYAKSQGGLYDKNSVLTLKQTDESDYNSFKNIFLFGQPWEAAHAMDISGKHIEFSSRLANDLAVFTAVLVSSAEGQKYSEISRQYGINEWFLKNRLIPRLRTLGITRLLKGTDLITKTQEKVLSGDAANPEAQMAAAVLAIVA